MTPSIPSPGDAWGMRCANLASAKWERNKKGRNVVRPGTRKTQPGNTCGCSSVGRAPPCQGGGSGIVTRQPLQWLRRESTIKTRHHGRLAEMVDAHGSGPCVLRT